MHNEGVTAAGNAFPGATPRPVAPELILRSFSFSPVSATHLRIRVLPNQCTGNGDFQVAWGGIAGLQTGFSSVWTEAASRGIPLARVIEWIERKVSSAR